MITRVENGQTYTQTLDAENRLISVTVSGQTTQFIYDGDGNLVKKVKPDNSKTIYPSTTLRAGVGGSYSIPFGDEVDKTSGGSVTRTVTYYPIAGTIAHEAMHHGVSGGSQLEEYKAALVGDAVRNQIIQAGYGTSSDMKRSLTKYTVDIYSTDENQLANELQAWFNQYYP